MLLIHGGSLLEGPLLQLKVGFLMVAGDLSSMSDSQGHGLRPTLTEDRQPSDRLSVVFIHIITTTHTRYWARKGLVTHNISTFVYVPCKESTKDD